MGGLISVHPLIFLHYVRKRDAVTLPHFLYARFCAKTVKLRVTDGRPLDSDFRGVGNGVLHAVVKSHQLCSIVRRRSGALGSLLTLL